MHILQDNLATASVTTDLLRLETFQWKNQAENASKQDDLLSELAQTTEERDQLAEDIVLLQKDVACEHANALEARTALEACRMRAGSELDKNKGEMGDAAAAIHRLEGIIEVTGGVTCFACSELGSKRETKLGATTPASKSG